jgi:hypothetical protein
MAIESILDAIPILFPKKREERPRPHFPNYFAVNCKNANQGYWPDPFQQNACFEGSSLMSIQIFFSLQ